MPTNTARSLDDGRDGSPSSTGALDTALDTASGTFRSRRDRSAVGPSRNPQGARLEVLEITRRPNPVQRLIDAWTYRELLGNLVRKELKVKYKDSILGFFWSLLNPALQIVVFSFVFGVIFKSGIPDFAIFMICGLLPWTFFTSAVSGGTGAVVGNSQLVNKVWFPREVLPLASVGSALVHWGLQSIVLAIALAVVLKGPVLTYLPLLPLAIIALVIFASAVAIALSAINVYLRDTQHLLELVLLAWFWVTPIVWGYPQVAVKLAQHGFPGWLGFANPLTPIVITFQRILYHSFVFNNPRMIGGFLTDGAVPAHSVAMYALALAVVIVGSLVLLWFALVLFGRLEDNFGQEV